MSKPSGHEAALRERIAQLEAQVAAASPAPSPKPRRQRRAVLDDARVASLPVKPKRYLHVDPQYSGLGVHGIRVTPGGKKIYYLVCRDGFGKQRWTPIGDASVLTISESRTQASEIARRLKRGESAREQAPDSVADVLRQWLVRHVQRQGLRTARQKERIVERLLIPRLGDRPFVEVGRRDLALLADAVEDASGGWMAESALAVFTAAAGWYASRNDVYTPPSTRRMSRVPSHKRKRKRILNDGELKALWTAASAADAGAGGALAKLALLTGQRRAKLVTLRWSDIDFASGVWTVRRAPREKGTPERLVLPEQAMRVIRSLPCIVGNPHIFASPIISPRRARRAEGERARGPRSGWHEKKVALAERSGVQGWHWHDLRRTCRSLLSRAGVLPHVAERVIGHAVGTEVEQIYDRHSYQEELTDALARLAALITSIVDPPPANVVPIRPAVRS